MRVLLISANTEQVNMPVMPLGVTLVKAAAEQAGHRVRAVNLMRPADTHRLIPTVIHAFKPEVIGISVRNIDDQSMASPRFLLDAVKPVVALCRKLSVAPVVLGGAGYSIFPREVLGYLGADAGIQGEGEAVFCAVLEHLARDGAMPALPGLFRPGHPDPPPPVVEPKIDRFPLAGPDPWSLNHPDFAAGKIWLPFQTRRGCAMGCSYCSTPAIEGRRLRKRAVDHVIAALARYRAAGVAQFFFVDNTFNLPPSYARTLCAAIIRAGIDIRWQAIVYPNFVDRELATLMARSGCVQVSLGFESGDAQMLAQMNKHFDPETVAGVAALFKSVGIRRMGFLMLGGPGETRRSVETSLAFAEALDLEMMRLTVGIRIYPHTRLAETALAARAKSVDGSLLAPIFYIAPELAEWLPGAIHARAVAHSHWIV